MGGMALRMELFVRDVRAAVAFYRDVLGFTVERESPGYVSVRNGDVVFDIGPEDGLPEGHHFGREALRRQKGVGVEIVLEVDDVAAYERRVRDAGYAVAAPLKQRPWGLTDFRVVDPDGYYVRVTSRG